MLGFDFGCWAVRLVGNGIEGEGVMGKGESKGREMKEEGDRGGIRTSLCFFYWHGESLLERSTEKRRRVTRTIERNQRRTFALFTVQPEPGVSSVMQKIL